MLYLVIYAFISPITIVLTCSEFLISDLHILSQVIEEKNEVEGLEDQGRLQKRLNKSKVEDPRQNLRNKKKHKNAAFEKQRNDRARHHHGLTHSHASPVCPGFFCFFRTFPFSCTIFRFMPFKR